MSDEKARSSVEASRDTALPVLPTVNPDAQKSAPEPPSFHPAVYIAYVRIHFLPMTATNYHAAHGLPSVPAQSSSTSTSSTLPNSVRALGSAAEAHANTSDRLPHFPHNMAFGLRDGHDPDPRPLHHHPRLKKEGAHDGARLSASHCPHRYLLQYELDLR